MSLPKKGINSKGKYLRKNENTLVNIIVGAKLCNLNKIELHFTIYNLWIKNHIYLNTKLG